MALRRNQHAYSAARKLRRRMSLPEVLQWRELKGGPNGVSFRKQHPIGPYVIDFYCAQAKTGFEIDGIAHDMGDRPASDETRLAWLEREGIRIVRIPAREVLASPGRIADSVVSLCREDRTCPLHHPLRGRSPSPLLRNGEDPGD